MLDAPCSGLGVLAKRADLRWNRTEAEITELKDLQDRLLDAASKIVRPGGLLVYSTCSIEPEENGDRAQAFLARHKDFSHESCSHLMHPSLMADGNLQTLPHEHQIDGAFAARLRRSPEGMPTTNGSTSRSANADDM